MSSMRVFIASTLLVLCGAGTLYAASGDFRVNMLIGDDTTPPTVPTNLTATPVAVSQIDLAWSSSTDNLAVAGYQVFRSGPATTTFGQIATTTATNYSDVGLLESTTYSYFVTAFDDAGNISASSSVVATTTLASTTPPAPSPSGGGSAPRIELEPVPIELVSLEIVPGTTSARFLYETEGYVRSIIRWGETVTYDTGSLQERAFRKGHETVINGLRPGTTYVFAIEGENHLGRFGILTAGTFTTLSPEDTFPPGNVTGLRGYIQDGDIVLEWNNPNDADFSHVRVLRNDRFFPSDTADGWLVYEGDGESALDEGAAAAGVTQYYTVFSYDEQGNISSGAVVAVSPSGEVELPGPPPVEEGLPEETEPIDLSFEDIVFVQDGEMLENDGRQVSVDGAKRLRVSVPYGLMPEHLKTILVEVPRVDGSGSDLFLLRVDEEREFYTTMLAPFTVAERFRATVSVYDFETFRIGSASGDIVSTIAYMPAEREDTGFLAYLRSIFDLEWWMLTGISFLFLLILLILILVWYRLAREKD